MSNISSFFIAFTAGLLSFFAPCVLPLIPAYLSYITGISFQDLEHTKDNKFIRKQILFHSIMFVLGFSVIFIALGISVTYFGQFVSRYINIIRIVGGCVIIIFGVQLTGIINIKFLQTEKKMHLKNKPMGYLGSFFIGNTFAAGWTPCVGPVLGSILIFASTANQILLGAVLLTAYSLGLGIPFILSAIFIDTFLQHFAKIKKHMRIITIISGVFLIIIGLLVITNYFNVIAQKISIAFM